MLYPFLANPSFFQQLLWRDGSGCVISGTYDVEQWMELTRNEQLTIAVDRFPGTRYDRLLLHNLHLGGLTTGVRDPKWALGVSEVKPTFSIDDINDISNVFTLL